MTEGDGVHVRRAPDASQRPPATQAARGSRPEARHIRMHAAILRAREYADQYLVKHEFIKRLHRRFDQEGIVIPFPIRALTHRA